MSAAVYHTTVAEFAGSSEREHELALALEEARMERGLAERNADLFAYQLLMGASRSDHDLPHKARLRIVKQARDIWKKDAQAGAAVRLFNDFVFGRGVQLPKCHDPVVQEVVEEAWNDPQNKRILTSHEAQRAKGVDLQLQSNLFLLGFSGRDGDGKFKLSLLDHDTVDGAVKDETNRHRILFYKAAYWTESWDYGTDRPVRSQQPTVRYYPSWGAVEEALEEGVEVKMPPPNKRGEGEVFHVSINRSSEMVFGHPEMHRVVQWYSAMNEFMASRVDLTKAAAAIWMKRKVKGGDSAVMRMAQAQLTRRSELASGTPEGAVNAPRGVAGILNENQAVDHEPFRVPTNAGEASQDFDMLHSQSSAAMGWPKHYTGGDAGALAGATALELPVLKLVEARQEVFEAIFRWFVDRVIEAAVLTGRIPDRLQAKELTESAREYRTARLKAIAAAEKPKLGETPEAYSHRVHQLMALAEAQSDSAETMRDLGYEFSMPNPLRRSMTDLMNVISTAAKTFDPNGTNIQLTRLMFGLTLSDVLEVENAQQMVEKVFPEDYVDPAVAAFQQQQADQQAALAQGAPPGQPPPGGQVQPGAKGADGQQHQADNAYGAPRNSPPPEQAARQMQQARFDALDGDIQDATAMHVERIQDAFSDEVWAELERGLADLADQQDGSVAATVAPG